jgi:5-methylcytosine-specific restriction endonuclease McrA
LGHDIPAGYDVDHKKPLSKGGSNNRSNLQLQKSGSNRSYPRKSSGAMRSRYD